jgi:hypothetical protein
MTSPSVPTDKRLPVDEPSTLPQEIVHLARLALTGRRQDLESLIRRIAHQHRRTAPAVYGELAALLRELPTPTSPVRSATVATVPVDSDSRLALLRVEATPTVNVEPVWPPLVRRALEQLVRERFAAVQLDAAGLTPSRAAMFSGPPGVGKTLAARWVARALGCPLFVLDLSAVMSSYLGRTGTNLRHVLDYAKGVGGILLLDEIDALAKRRDDAQEIGELKRLVTVLLQEIDDWPPSGLLIAATNHPDLLDPAAWRRFDVQIKFPMPDRLQVREAVTRFITSHDSHAGLESPALLEALVQMAVGRSFADIEREILGLRRAAIVDGTSLDPHVVRWLGEQSLALPRRERASLAATLDRAGLSQRQVSELTGVSRDTLRKMQHRPHADGNALGIGPFTTTKALEAIKRGPGSSRSVRARERDPVDAAPGVRQGKEITPRDGRERVARKSGRSSTASGGDGAGGRTADSRTGRSANAIRPAAERDTASLSRGKTKR